MTEHAGHAVTVGVDGSQKDTYAVDWAAAEAARRGAPLHILYAFAFATTGYGLVPPFSVEDFGGEITARAAERARTGREDLEVTTSVVADDPASALVRASGRAGLVVVGARGLGRIAGRLLGSVSQKVAAHAHGPVVVVRDTAARPSGPVVVGVDPADTLPQILEFAFEHAVRCGAGVRIVHAHLIDEAAARDAGVARMLGADAEARAMKVAALAEEWSGRFPEVSVDVREADGHAIEALTEHATEASLLVVGSRGRKGLAGTRLGSVALGVLHEAPVVAVVRVSPHGPG